MTPREVEVLRTYNEKVRIKDIDSLTIDHLARLGLMKVVVMKNPAFQAHRQQVQKYAHITEDGIAYLNSLEPEKGWFGRLVGKLFKSK